MPTGLAFGIPSGMQLEIRPRSGNAHKLGLTVTNAPGTVDQGYTGEVFVSLLNTNPLVTHTAFDVLLDVMDEAVSIATLSDKFSAEYARHTIRIRRGDRIAQAVLMPVITADFEEVATLDVTERGAGGIGHTGA